MKNIQIIDGAVNSIFEIYEISDDLFMLIFPQNTDISFLADIEKILHKSGGGVNFWNEIYRKKINKKHVEGIHGTLHLTGSNCKREYFSTLKEDDI